jgi:1-acyl-sn-glycerol-3-phosphate acyltransferase
MRLLGRFFLGIWGFTWAVLASVVIGTIYLIGVPFGREPDWTDRIQRLYCRAMLLCIGIRVRVEGSENIPDGQACVMMANHRSYLDIPAVVMGLRQISVLFVAKRELTRIPFFGWALWASHHIKVDRADREQAIAALKESVKKIGDGVGLAVFPEGTRSLSNRLLPFKKGGFYVAVDTGFAVLPVSIQNSGNLFGKRDLLPRPGIITLVVHPSVSTSGKTREDIPDLIREIRATMLAGLPDAAALERGTESSSQTKPTPGSTPASIGRTM